MSRELLVTTDEVGTKGGNRLFFEKILRRNVWNALGRRSAIVPRRLFGRTSVPLPDDVSDEQALDAMRRVPGAANVQIARRVPNDVEAMTKLAIERALAEKGDAKSFGVRVQRSWKTFPMQSREIEREVGGPVKVALDLPVNLTDPDLWIHLQVTEQGTFVATGSIRGLGGLPVRSTGKAVALLSGGLDSPVAAYRMFLRGTQCTLLHFLNESQDPGTMRGKIDAMTQALTRYQQKSVLYVVPFMEIQRELVAQVPSPFRMIAYRRVMMRIAGRIAAKETCGAIVTGDMIGQVASQTMANLTSIWDAAELPVLAPLIGMRKQEVVNQAKEIGTYEVSSEPGADCCQFMIAEHPATRSTIEELVEYESRIPDLAELEEKAANIQPEVSFDPPRTGERYPPPRRSFWRRRRRS